METQQHLFVPKYTIVINEEEHHTYTIKEAFSKVKEYPLGSTYFIYYYGTKMIVPETITFS